MNAAVGVMEQLLSDLRSCGVLYPLLVPGTDPLPLLTATAVSKTAGKPAGNAHMPSPAFCWLKLVCA